MKTIEEQLDEEFEIWNPEVGDKLIGEFVEARPNSGKYGNTMYVLRMDNGKIVGIWSSTVIAEKLKDAVMGAKIGIKYMGEAEGERGKYKNFKVVVENPQP